MDEEELGATGKKITIANFFESIKKIDKVANDALEASQLNVGKVDVATEEIEKLKKIVTAIQTDIQTLQDNDKIRRDELEDRLVAQQDALQKAEMIQRQKELKGEKGDKGDQGAPGTSGRGEDRKDTPKQGGGGFFSNIGQGIIGAGSIVAASIFNPLAAIMGGNYGGMPTNQSRDRVTPPKTNLLETINPFARLGGMFGRKKDEKKEVKEEIKSEIKQELNLKDDKKKNKLTGRGMEAGYFDDEDKKENKLMNFVKRGGVAGFLGRKIFGKKDNKAQEVGATNPEENTSYSESFSYEGRFDPKTLEFIPDEGSLPPGVPLEKAQQDVYKSKIEMIEFDFRSNIMQGMTREDAIESYGPQSNLYRFKENYNKTLEYGGYELDVGKHYDSIKNSMSGKKKGKGQDSSLKGEKRGIKGVIGGVADALTGGFFNFDKRGNTKLQDFQQGTADTLTGGFFDFDKKGDTKLQDFAQGTADTLTGGIFDFDEKGSTKLQRFGQGFMDAMTGNLTDFDRKGGKTVGPTRAVTGIADFLTGNLFDLDKRGGFNLFGKGKKKKLRDEDGRYIGDNARKKNFQNTMDKYGPGDGESYSREQELDTNFDINTGRAYVNGIEVDPMAYAEFKQLPIKEQLDTAGAFVIENRVNKIEPVVESKEKDLSSNIYKEIDNTNEAVSNLVTQNVAQTGNANDQNTSMQVPANEPQVSDAEIKSARPNIPFISVLTDKTKKEMSLTSEGSSEIAGYID